MKRSKTGALGALLLGASLAATGCGSDSAASGDSDMVRIGITQIVEHDALTSAKEGFKRALAANGYTEGENISYDEQNAAGEQATATSIASKFASDDLDLVLAIATPTAQAAAQAITDIPILITAVTEPEEAGLVDSWDAPGGNLTGTSDLNPVEDQLGLIKELAPEAKTVGIVYSSGEVNSEVQIELAQEAAKDLGLELKLAAVSNTAEVQQAAESLDVDAFYIPTDNNVVAALDSVVQIAETKKIPLVTGDAGSVEAGGLATWGIDYELLGYQTGMMAIKILEEDADPATMPIETLTETKLVINKSAAANMGIEIPASMLDEADQVIE